MSIAGIARDESAQMGRGVEGEGERGGWVSGKVMS